MNRPNRCPDVAMPKIVFYRQCRLAKPTDAGELRQMSWIPDRFAVLDKVLQLREPDGKWDNGWVVTSVGSNRLRDDELPDFHEESKAHLRATGDAATARK
jgi:hypothetical protein